MDWQLIHDNLDALQDVEGGFTNATRGVLSLLGGKKVFVKIGVDPITKAWAKKEIGIYETLQANNFAHIPQLVLVNDDATGFALEYLSTEDGWEWETDWTEARLSATLQALDELAALPTDIFAPELLEADSDDVNTNPWHISPDDTTSTTLLAQRLQAANKPELADQLDDLQRNFAVRTASKVLVHYDVRRDNCAWNPKLQTVKLIDWNWLHAGNRSIDVCALLVNVHKSGLSLTGFEDRLQYDALMWLTGYWLMSSIQPGLDTMSDADALRSYQFASAMTAYDLAQEYQPR